MASAVSFVDALADAASALAVLLLDAFALPPEEAVFAEGDFAPVVDTAELDFEEAVFAAAGLAAAGFADTGLAAIDFADAGAPVLAGTLLVADGFSPAGFAVWFLLPAAGVGLTFPDVTLDVVFAT